MKTLIFILSLTPLAIYAAQQPAKKIYGPEEVYLSLAKAKEFLRKHDEKWADGQVWHYEETWTRMTHKNVLKLTKEDLKKRILRAKAYNENWDHHYLQIWTIGPSKLEFEYYGSSLHNLFCHFDASISLGLYDDECGFVTDIVPVTCQQINDSLLQKLDLSRCPHLNEESKLRLIEAWKKPTVIFPEGRLLENLMLPPKKTSSTATVTSASTASTAATK